MKKSLVFLLMLVCIPLSAVERLQNKVVLITGASQGIGKGVAEVFAKEGAEIIIVSRNEGKMKEVVDQISKTGGKISYMIGNIASEKDMDHVAEQIVKKHGRIDVLIHNAAALYPYREVVDMPYSEWRDAMSSNLDAVFLVTKSVLPYMKEHNYGRIVYTSSISGPKVGLPGKSNYTATKGGLEGFMKSVAIEVAKYGITVNAVEPGNIETEGLTSKNSPQAIKERAAGIPMKRFGTTHEVAYAHLFLSTDEAKYITGQSIVVDGGQTLPETHFGL